MGPRAKDFAARSLAGPSVACAWQIRSTLVETVPRMKHILVQVVSKHLQQLVSDRIAGLQLGVRQRRTASETQSQLKTLRRGTSWKLTTASGNLNRGWNNSTLSDHVVVEALKLGLRECAGYSSASKMRSCSCMRQLHAMQQYWLRIWAYGGSRSRMHSVVQPFICNTPTR